MQTVKPFCLFSWREFASLLVNAIISPCIFTLYFSRFLRLCHCVTQKIASAATDIDGWNRMDSSSQLIPLDNPFIYFCDFCVHPPPPPTADVTKFDRNKFRFFSLFLFFQWWHPAERDRVSERGRKRINENWVKRLTDSCCCWYGVVFSPMN